MVRKQKMGDKQNPLMLKFGSQKLKLKDLKCVNFINVGVLER